MNIGKLYQIKKWFWFLYPSKETPNYINTVNLSSAAGSLSISIDRERARRAANMADVAFFSYCWTKVVNENISYIEPNCMFVLLEQDQQYGKILTANGELGWIVLNDWCIADMDIVEVNSVNSLECSDRVET
jgi:hypothetical protein